MSKRLTHNLNSAYFEAANRLRPSRMRKRIVAYVESFDDVAFWRNILDEYEDDRIYFEIKLPSRNTLGKGKRQALMNLLGADNLGSAMIACVDADYDYLLQDTSEESNFINHSPYVIHTYVYAIESYQCWAPSLHRVVVTATLNDRPTLDFEAFMSEYSQIIWPLFVWNIWCYRNDKYKAFTMMDFCGFISFRSVNTRRPEETLAQLKRRVNQKIAWLQRHFPEARKTYAPLRAELQDTLHLRPEETYLYIQGHTLFENVITPLLEPVCAMLRKEREREIKELAMHTKQRQCELSSYQHSVMPIDVVLKKNTAFMEAPQMTLLKARVEHFLQEARQRLLRTDEANKSGSADGPATANSSPPMPASYPSRAH